MEDIALLKFEILFASFFLILLICRFFYMKKTQKTSLPENTNRAQKIAAKTVHYSMYVTLASIPLTGIIIGFIYWIGFKDGFIIDTMITIHEASIILMYWLVAIHVSAAIFHRFLGDGVWSSMVPFFKERVRNK